MCNKKKKGNKLFGWLTKTAVCLITAFTIAIAPVVTPMMALAQENPGNEIAPEATTIESPATTIDDATAVEDSITDPVAEEVKDDQITLAPGDNIQNDQGENSGGNGSQNEELIGCNPDPDPNPEVPCGENAIINGDFEQPIVVTPQKWNIYNSYAPELNWTAKWVGGSSFYQGHWRPFTAKVELQAGYSDWLAANGNQYAELDTDWDGPDGSLNGEPASIRIYQDLTTIPDKEYQVSFYFSPRPGTSIEDNILEFSWGGIVIDTISEAGGSNVNWTSHTYTLTATNAVTRVQFADLGNPNSLGTFLDDVVAYEICDELPEPCTNGPGWANEVTDSHQGTRKDGSAVNVDRSDPTSALYTPDEKFFSLGREGSLVVIFDGYVFNEPGMDLSFHETTYGRASYPEETALIAVSQDGAVWYEIGTASNHAVDNDDGISYLDFDSTGLAWIKYVKLTDTTNYDPHSNDADGFDVNAIDATFIICNYVEIDKTGSYDWLTNQINYIINWAVVGEGIAYDVKITDTIPADTEFVLAVPVPTSISGDSILWELGDVAAPDNGTILLTVKLTDSSAVDPWADAVMSFNQGFRWDGTPVVAERSHPEKALGEAERNDTVNFVSLGFGDNAGKGELILGFDNYIVDRPGPDIEVVETSFGNPSEEAYPETAKIYASKDQSVWTFLKEIVLDDADVDLDAGGLDWAKFVKVVDVSDRSKFTDTTTTDGFDVDGIQALNSLPNVCEVENNVEISELTKPKESGEGPRVRDYATVVTTINERACNEEPPQVYGSVSGMKFSDRNRNHQKDEGEEGLEGWRIGAVKGIETLFVDAHGEVTGTPISTSFNSVAGREYFFRASGTFNAGDLITADAKYSVREPNTIWTDIVQNYEIYGPTLLDLHINGSAPNWGGGIYNGINHAYWYNMLGDGNPFVFQIRDIYAYNNVGQLKVQIWEVLAADTTDENGNYALDLTGIDGKVVIAEERQRGWIQTYPYPTTYYVVSTDVDSTGLDFGNYNTADNDDGGGFDLVDAQGNATPINSVNDDGNNGGGGGGSGGGGGGGGNPPAGNNPPGDEVLGDQDSTGGSGGGTDETVLGERSLVAAGSNLSTLLLVMLLLGLSMSVLSCKPKRRISVEK